MSDTKPEAVLIDLSSLAHMIYHVSASEPDPDYTSKAVVDRVHALTQGVDHVGVMCDSGGPSFRRELSPEYKANRPERDAILMHQMDLIREQLAADGFPVFSAPGYEADDLLATATATARAAGHPVLIVTADKDLLQLVTDEDPAVRCKNVQSGNVLDTEGVIQKLGVLPAQVCDWLSLVGDASDNVKGATGIGAKGAVELLKQFGTLDDLYAVMAEVGLSDKVTPKRIESLREFKERLPLVRSLIQLADVPDVDLSPLLQPRAVPAMASEDKPMTNEEQMNQDIAETMPDTKAKCDGNHGEPMCADPECWQTPEPLLVAPVKQSSQTQALARVVTGELVPYERQLEPRNMQEAITLAKDMFTARNFAGASSPQTALATIMMGREMGIGPLTALRTIHVIEGKHCMSAQLIVGQVLKSGLVEYVEPVSVSEASVTYRAKRKGRPEVTLTHTIEMAQQAGLVKPKSGWEKNPTDMLVSRCSSRICRMVAPDVCATLYTPEEIREMRESDNG